MPNFLLSPNMNLPIPVPGVDPGPDYANNLNSSLTLIDQHNHSPGYGVQINPSGLDINADLSFNSNNATDMRSVRFSSQGSPLALVTDLDCIYVSGVDLWYNDGNGNQVKITNNGSVNATTSGIFDPPASAEFVAGTLVVDADVNTPANIQVASVLLGNNVANSKFLTLQPPNAMAANYSITLPALPASTSPLQIDSSGNITAGSSGGLSPTGSITMYGGAAAPTGWLLCDGTSYLRATYPDLFSAIGVAYGTADGTHFNVPDFRGIFPRGVDNGAGNDPDSASRIAANPGGNTGDNVGSFQADELASHFHHISPQLISNTAPTTNFPNAGASGKFNLIDTDPTGGNETRPKNLYVNFIIKI